MVYLSFSEFLKSKKNINHKSQFTGKGPSIAERVIRTIRNLIKKPVFEQGNANWFPVTEFPSVTKQYNNTIHSSTKMTSIQAFKKSYEKLVYSNLQGRRDKQLPKFILGHLVRSADIKRVFSKGDSTNYSYKLYTVREVIRDTIPSYRVDYLPERYDENLLLSTKLSTEQNNQDMKDINLVE